MDNNAFYAMMPDFAQSGAAYGVAPAAFLVLASGAAGFLAAMLGRQWAQLLNAVQACRTRSGTHAALHQALGLAGLRQAGAWCLRRPAWRPRPLTLGSAACMAGAALWLLPDHGLSLSLVASLAMLCVLLVLAIVDARTGFLPDVLTLPLLWGGLALSWHEGPGAVHGAVAGVMAAYLSLAIGFHLYRYIRRREGMGRGDFKLFAALGAWLGAGMLPYVLASACMAGILHAFLQTRRPRLLASRPFGPFLAGAGALALLIK